MSEIGDTKYIKEKEKKPGIIPLLAEVPALSMILITFAILVLDVLYNSMASEQYDVYMKIWHWSAAISGVCGMVFIADRYLKDGFRNVIASNANEDSQEERSGHGIRNTWNDLKAEITAWYHRLDKAERMQLWFVICMILSTIENGFVRSALLGLPYRSLGVVHYLALVIVYVICSASISSKGSRYMILNLFLMLADLLVIGLIYDQFTTAVEAFRDGRTNSTVFFNSNHYAYFLVMAVLIAAGYYLFAERDLSTFGGVSMILNLAALGMNRSMGGIIAVVVVIVAVSVYAIRQRTDQNLRMRAIILLGIFAIGAVAVIVFSEGIRRDVIILVKDLASVLTGHDDGDAGSGRWILWIETVKYIGERPVLGWGCEGIASKLLEATGLGSPHFEILTYAAFFGIPAAIFYTVWVVRVLIRSWKNIRTQREQGSSEADRISSWMAAAGYFISSMFGVAIFYTLPFFFIFLGMSDTKIKADTEPIVSNS